MIIVDSGLGGISVVRALRALQPDIVLTYLADTAGFPYGKRNAQDVSQRGMTMVRTMLAQYPASAFILACNTLSTLALKQLRDSFAVPFVGTVPAVKTAALRSVSKRFTLLATPNTAASQYTQELISEFARDCVVDVYGAPNLAAMAEAYLLSGAMDMTALRAELRPAFCDDALGKTDCMVLGCTHYPLIVDALQAAASWPVTFVDSAEAIARRALSLPRVVAPSESVAYVTAPHDIARYREVFLREGFADVRTVNLV